MEHQHKKIVQEPDENAMPLPVETVDYRFLTPEEYAEDAEAWQPIKIMTGEYSGIVFQVRALDLEALGRSQLKFDMRITEDSENPDLEINITQFRTAVSGIILAVLTDWQDTYNQQKDMDAN